MKIRGNASHIADKYQALSRDAAASGDRIAAEGYLQHAEHYIRIVQAAQAQQLERQQAAEQERRQRAERQESARQANGNNNGGGGADTAKPSSKGNGESPQPDVPDDAFDYLMKDKPVVAASESEENKPEAKSNGKKAAETTESKPKRRSPRRKANTEETEAPTDADSDATGAVGD